ncbi:MAG TPA: glycosyltransferase family 4 protein [Solirubrobacteraceae bacterium]|nr:glycosyltransferase family 4 protein [Solirubrobacteraceae bacterium]
MKRPLVGVVVPAFPVLSESFVAGEVRRLGENGVRVLPIVLDRASRAHAGMLAELRAAGIEPVYLLEDRRGLLGRAAAWALRHPRLAARAWRLNARAPLPGSASRAARWVKVLAVLRLVEQRGVDRLHSHWTLPGDVALLAHRLTGIPFAMSAHAVDIYDPEAAVDAPPGAGGLRDKVREADFVATCTGQNRAYLAQIAPDVAGRIDLVYHGVDLAVFDGRKQDGEGPPLVLSVGRLVPKKGFLDLVRACGVLHREGVALRCAIVGDGPQRDELEAAIREEGLEGVVRLLGGLPHGEVRDLLRRSAVAVLCPRAEEGHYGIPNVLFEALAMRTPAITRRLPAVHELIDHGRTGFVFDEQDELVDHLRATLLDRDLRERMGEAGRREIEARFDADRTIRPLAARLTAPASAG